MADSDANVVIVAGAEAIRAGSASTLRDIADRTFIGVFNTWPAKGLFPWNHPAHLGTIGLQRDDIVLAGLADFDEVILCGVSNDELSREGLDALGVRWRDVIPGEIDKERLPVRRDPTPRPALYGRLAAVCQPMYADGSLPLNPARAAADLATLLPDDGLVAGDADRAGFWLGRAFPTRQLGSVQLPVRATPGFAATQAMTARRVGRFSVAVVDHVDAATESVLGRARDLIVELWSDSGPATSPDERARRLGDAHDRGGVHVVELGVRFSDIGALVVVAGAALWNP